MMILVATLVLPATISLVSAQESDPSEVVLAQATDLTSLEATYFTDQPTRSVTANIVESLFRRGHESVEFEMQNLLADSYEANEDFTVWDITVREGVTFHNGDELNAESVKFTIDAILDPNREPESVLKSKIIVIDSVEVIDTLTVRITLTNPDPFLRERLASVGIVSPQYYESHDEAYLSTNINGTGPFRFVEWVKGDRIVLEANAEYWNGAPSIDRVVYRIIPESGARLASLQTGEVDIIGDVPIDDIEWLEEEEGIVLETVQTEYAVTIGINALRGGPLADRRVRQALNYAVDVEAIITHLLGGRGERNPTLLSSLNFGYADLEPYPYDPERARQLLQEAGVPEGFEVSFTASEGRFPKDREVAQAVADYLRAVGLDVTLRTLPFQEFIQLKNAKQLGDLWMVGWSSGSQDGLDNMTWIARSNSTLWAEQLMEHPESDRLMELAASETNLEQRAEYLQQVQQLFHEEAFGIFLYSVINTYAARDCVQGWLPPSDELMTVGVETSVTCTE